MKLVKYFLQKKAVTILLLVLTQQKQQFVFNHAYLH